MQPFLSDIICFIYLSYKTKLKYQHITKEEINNVKSYGLPYSLERIFFRVLYGILASRLGTNKYSIHTICYSVCLTFFIIAVFGLYQYETYKTLCITEGKSFILFIGSSVGAIIRTLVCLLFIHSSFSLYIFGLANFIDFYFRNIVYRIGLYKLQKIKCIIFYENYKS